MTFVYLPQIDEIGELIRPGHVILQVYIPAAVRGRRRIKLHPIRFAYVVPEQHYITLD